MSILKWLSSRIFWGIILIFGGITLLLENLNIFSLGNYFWGFVFCLAGITFFSIYLENRSAWWAFIPGFTLLAIGISSLLDSLAPQIGENFGGAIFFVGIALGFIAVYIVERQNWWAVIPAGVLLTLGAVDITDHLNLGIDSGAIFFVGLGITFAILALLPGYEAMLRWAYIPAGVLLVIGLFIAASSSEMINLVVPAILILIGIGLVIRTIMSNRKIR